MKRTVRLAGVLLFSALVVPSVLGQYCEDCYRKFITPRRGAPYFDAQCCFSGTYHCENLEFAGWDQMRSNLSFCRETWTDVIGYECEGDSGPCTSFDDGTGGGTGGGGGGGGGSSCTIQVGHLCPATCFSCTTQWY